MNTPVPSTSNSTPVLASLQAFSVYNYVFQASVAKRHGLHSTDLLALHYITQQQATTPKQIAATLGLSSGATTALLDRLERKKLVTRQTTATDRRKVIIQPNTAADNALAAEYADLSRHLIAVLDTYTSEELAIIERFLGDMTNLT